MKLEDLEKNCEESLKVSRELIAVARCTENLVSSWEAMEAINAGGRQYFIDFSPWISSCRNALNELDNAFSEPNGLPPR